MACLRFGLSAVPVAGRVYRLGDVPSPDFSMFWADHYRLETKKCVTGLRSLCLGIPTGRKTFSIATIFLPWILGTGRVAKFMVFRSDGRESLMLLEMLNGVYKLGFKSRAPFFNVVKG